MKVSKESKPITEKKFDLSSFKKDIGLTSSVKDKDIEWFPLSPAFYEATKLPGVPKGYMTLARGYSNTGKSTTAVELIASCQKMGVLPILYDTENSFDWDHAKLCGIQYTDVANEETGEIIDHDGFFIYLNNNMLVKKYGKFKYDEGKEGSKQTRFTAVVEDIAKSMNDFLDMQARGELPYEICFIWDSVGSLNCYKGVISSASNQMWVAGSVSSCFSDIINNRIPSSRKEDQKYTNTFFAVQKIWLDSMNGAGVVKHKGGEAFFYAARLILHFGGIVSHSTKSVTATSDKKSFSFGIETKLKVVKNQITGVNYDSVIVSVPHGFISVEEIPKYKKEKAEYLLNKMGLESGDIEVVVEEIDNNEIELG